jgi:hypothetical protein
MDYFGFPKNAAGGQTEPSYLRTRLFADSLCG